MSARVVMPVRAIPSASKIRCHTTTNTLDNTCDQQSSVHCVWSWFCKPHLLYDDIAGQKKGDCDSNDEENIVPALLGASPHELLVVDAEEEADGEEGEKAAVEHLSHEDHHEAVNWGKVQIEVFLTITATF